MTSTENKSASREWVFTDGLISWSNGRVHVIEKSAFDQLQKENEELKEAISHLPKVPTQPYEKELAQQLSEAKREIEKAHRWNDENAAHAQRFLAERNTLKSQCAKLVDALKFYAFQCDNEVSFSMDTEFLEPEKRAVIKPLNKIGEAHGDPSMVHQDRMFTYGPKFRIGKLARQTLAELTEEK